MESFWDSTDKTSSSEKDDTKMIPTVSEQTLDIPDVVFYTGFLNLNILTVTHFWFDNFERQRTNLIGLFGKTLR